MKVAVLALAALAVAHDARADVATLAPGLAGSGNLRVAVACAERAFVRPEDGLRITIDGAAVAPLRERFEDSLELDADGNPVLTVALTDIDFAVAPGRHRVAFAAPDCAPVVRELDLSATTPERVDGRLPVADEALQGPTVAPDGFGLAIGAFAMPLPAGVSTATHVTMPGVWLSTSIERRSWLFAADSTSGWTSIDETSPIAASGSVWGTAAALRVGRRVARDRYALAAGTGLAAGVWTASRHPVAGALPTIPPPSGVTFDWGIPVWSAVTVKASCSWGVQGLARYDVRPTDLGASSLALAVGVQWQPSHTCSDAPGLVASP